MDVPSPHQRGSGKALIHVEHWGVKHDGSWLPEVRLRSCALTGTVDVGKEPSLVEATVVARFKPEGEVLVLFTTKLSLKTRSIRSAHA